MRIDPKYFRLLQTEDRTVLLGIITREGEVMLRPARRDTCPGHAEWCRLEPDVHPEFGFSLIAANGRVQVIMKASRLNPPERDFLPPEGVRKQLEGILPLDDDFRQYGH